MIDVGTLARIRSGDIAVRKGVESFDGKRSAFRGRHAEHFDAVVLATGITPPVLAAMLPDYASLLDAHERPRACGSETAFPGSTSAIRSSSTGMLRQIGSRQWRSVVTSLRRRRTDQR
jgi:hypothetical protein